jgi:hypothetical protein
MYIGTSAVEQADDGGIDVPHLIRVSRKQVDFRFGGMDSESGTPPSKPSHEAVPH